MNRPPPKSISEYINNYPVNRKRANPEGREELRNAVEEEAGPDYMNDPEVTLANKVQRLIEMHRDADQNGTLPNHNVPTTTGSSNNPDPQLAMFQHDLWNYWKQMTEIAQAAMNQQAGLNFQVPAELQLKSLIPPINPIMHVQIGKDANPESIDLNPFGAAPSSSGAAHTPGCCNCVLLSLPQRKVKINKVLEEFQRAVRLYPEPLQVSHFNRIDEKITTAINTMRPEKEMEFDRFEAEFLQTLQDVLKFCDRHPQHEDICFSSDHLLKTFLLFFHAAGSPRLNDTMVFFARLEILAQESNIKIPISQLTEIYESLIEFITENE
ncbi:unnamed protein product [Caenorhabditis brenneri]